MKRPARAGLFIERRGRDSNSRWRYNPHTRVYGVVVPDLPRFVPVYRMTQGYLCPSTDSRTWFGLVCRGLLLPRRFHAREAGAPPARLSVPACSRESVPEMTADEGPSCECTTRSIRAIRSMTCDGVGRVATTLAAGVRSRFAERGVVPSGDLGSCPTCHDPRPRRRHECLLLRSAALHRV
jgi:hypothetical protein